MESGWEGLKKTSEVRLPGARKHLAKRIRASFYQNLKPYFFVWFFFVSPPPTRRLEIFASVREKIQNEICFVCEGVPGGSRGQTPVARSSQFSLDEEGREDNTGWDIYNIKT